MSSWWIGGARYTLGVMEGDGMLGGLVRHVADDCRERRGVWLA